MYAIDLNVYITHKQVEIKEKALVAYEESTGKICAFGQEIEKYENVEGIIVTTPFKFGKITNYNCAVAIFKHIVDKAYKEAGISPYHLDNQYIYLSKCFVTH